MAAALAELNHQVCFRLNVPTSGFVIDLYSSSLTGGNVEYEQMAISVALARSLSITPPIAFQLRGPGEVPI